MVGIIKATIPIQAPVGVTEQGAFVNQAGEAHSRKNALEHRDHLKV